jgi:hypothetical protein
MNTTFASHSLVPYNGRKVRGLLVAVAVAAAACVLGCQPPDLQTNLTDDSHLIQGETVQVLAAGLKTDNDLGLSCTSCGLIQGFGQRGI